MLYFVLLAWTLGLVRLLEILMVLVMILEDGIGINNNTITIAYFIKTVSIDVPTINVMVMHLMERKS
jgi:hypothetical protein